MKNSFIALSLVFFSLVSKAATIFPEDDFQFFSQPTIAGFRILSDTVDGSQGSGAYISSSESNDVDGRSTLGSARRFCWSQGFFDGVEGVAETIRGDGWNGTGVNGFFKDSRRTQTLYGNVHFNQTRNRLLSNVKCVGRGDRPPQSKITTLRSGDWSTGIGNNRFTAIGMLFSGNYSESERDIHERNFLNYDLYGSARRLCKKKGYEDAIAQRARGLRDDELECGGEYCYYDDYDVLQCECDYYESSYGILEFAKEDLSGNTFRGTYSSYPDIFDSVTCYSRTEERQPTYLNQIGKLEIVNAATRSSAIGREHNMITIFGEKLTDGETQTASGPSLPLELAGTSVRVNGDLMKISYASPTQLNVLLTDLIDGEAYTVEVRARSRLVGSGQITPVKSAPGFYTFASGDKNYGVGQYSNDEGGSFSPIVDGNGPVSIPVTERRTLVKLYGNSFMHINAQELGNGVWVDDVRAEITTDGPLPGAEGLQQLTMVIPNEVKSHSEIRVIARSYGVDSPAVYLKLNANAGALQKARTSKHRKTPTSAQRKAKSKIDSGTK